MQATWVVIKLCMKHTQKKKHIKRTLKKYVLVQLHHGIHWTSSPLMLSSNFNSSLICQLGLGGSASLSGKFPLLFNLKKCNGNILSQVPCFLFSFQKNKKSVVNSSLIIRFLRNISPHFNYFLVWGNFSLVFFPL